jgi:lysophospholipid acyltransferase
MQPLTDFLTATPGIRFIKGSTLRHIYVLLFGFLLCIYPFGNGVIQIVPPTLLSFLAIRLFPRHCFELTWIATFPYLVWLQVINASGLNVNRGGIDFVGAIMVLTLKLISLAGCRQDSYVKSADRPLSPYRASHVLNRPPSLLEYLSFVFGIGNLLAGPYVEFTEHVDFMELKGDWAGGVPLGLDQGFFLFLQGISFMGSHLALISIYGWGITGVNLWILSDLQKSRPLALRLGYQVFCGFAHQIKYYLLWKFSESAAVFSGFDFLGWVDSSSGPGDLKGQERRARWGRVTNVRLLGMWGSDSARVVPQHWNIRTGVFLKVGNATPYNKS